MPAADAIAQVAGLQAQAQVPPFVGLWTRLADFDAAELQGLVDERRIVRATLMRHTIHFVRAEDYVWLRPTIQPALDANFAMPASLQRPGTVSNYPRQVRNPPFSVRRNGLVD